MNALLILDAKEIVQISSKDKSETLSSNMSAKRLVLLTVANIENDLEIMVQTSRFQCSATCNSLSSRYFGICVLVLVSTRRHAK